MTSIELEYAFLLLEKTLRYSISIVGTGSLSYEQKSQCKQKFFLLHLTAAFSGKAVLELSGYPDLTLADKAVYGNSVKQENTMQLRLGLSRPY